MDALSAEFEPSTTPKLDLDSMRAIERPHGDLLKYYALFSMIAGPFFWAILLPLYWRFRTLRYTFDDEGIAQQWGVLFRREVHLTYDRIQDIHLVSNAVERWLGLGRVQIQTASGSAKAEMTIEGIKEFEAVRDFLYTRMRGQTADPAPSLPPADTLTVQVATQLEQAADDLAAIRRALSTRQSQNTSD